MVSVIASPSFIHNNLTTNDGEYYAYVNNMTVEGQPKAIIYSREIIEKGEISQPQILQWKDSSECFQIKYAKASDKWHLVICTSKGCQVWNHNATRQLTFLESKKKVADGKSNFFTAAGTGFDVSGKDFIAIGTALGEIYFVQANGSSYNKDIGFQMTDESAITAFAGDSKSKTLAVGNSNGYVVIFECDNQTEWKPLHSIPPQQELPITSMGTLHRGDNLYVVGFVNGIVQLINPNGQVLVEVAAHSRCLNALVCHPTKSVFATCSDDTFVNIFEVSGDKIEKIDVSLIISSRVNDYQMCGIAFGGEQNNSIVSVPYDFKSIAVWNNII